VLDTLTEITAVSVDHGSLEAREHMLARLAALVAVDAPAASYVLNVDRATEVAVTLEDVQGVLVAVAPIVGTARVVSRRNGTCGVGGGEDQAGARLRDRRGRGRDRSRTRGRRGRSLTRSRRMRVAEAWPNMRCTALTFGPG
jgi:hypothetical protein